MMVSLIMLFSYLAHALGASAIMGGFAVGLANSILNTELYAAMLIVIAVTTLLPPFALKWFYAKWGNKPGLAANPPPP